MDPVSIADIVGALPQDDSWGPPVSSETTLNGVPYAPFSKSDKLGRMADWTTEGKEGRDRGGRQAYNRAYRDQQVYGAQAGSLFAVQLAEDESSFSVVDNTRPSTRGRGFGRGGGTVFRGRGQRGGFGQRGGRGGFQRVGAGRGGQPGGDRFYDNRGGRGGGRGGRRFGWKDWDKPQRNRDSSVAIRPEWTVLEEIDFSRLSKLNLDTPDGEDIDQYGFLYYYDRSYDKAPVRNTERKLQSLDRAAYNVTTTADPVIHDLAEKDEATVFATADILSMLMCATRSVYSWDIVIVQQGNKIFFDKRDNASIDLVTVNENAADAPLEISESSKQDAINTPGALALEATIINHNFALQTVLESETAKVEFPHSNPFYNAADETEPLASKAFKYRRFDLSLEKDEEPLNLIVRTEVDAVMKNTVSGDDQQIIVKALNEFDHKAQGSGGALDWRTKLASQRGAVVATEMKNNSVKLARWTTQAILAKADLMKLGFVARANPRSASAHIVLGAVGYKPRDFATQMNLNLSNGWGIVRTIVDLVRSYEDEEEDEEEEKDSEKPRKFILVKDPNKSVLRLYSVPANTFEEDEEAEQVPEEKTEEDEE
ncbi:eukaryotic translation initiation factor 3 subunit D [Polytolypa hystricis UAMH7299]|uniref:Eukaryotic translation initiation factor 3 subunit D n=1 Tax=Polytolypa hystricis (strain UAMH7299) TaxID=1447883 RepID=A0A2B7Y1A1_POLH7|nr:eukaryotic translation initiation factor 3 subunit D [Polytolypa hystricis UAMH7299]